MDTHVDTTSPKAVTWLQGHERYRSDLGSLDSRLGAPTAGGCPGVCARRFAPGRTGRDLFPECVCEGDSVVLERERGRERGRESPSHAMVIDVVYINS